MTDRPDPPAAAGPPAAPADPAPASAAAASVPVLASPAATAPATVPATAHAAHGPGALLRRWLRLAILSLPLILGLAHWAGAASGAFRLGFVEALDRFLDDTRQRWAAGVQSGSGVDPRIVIVDIDEKSLAEVGRWPWGRDRLAALTEALFERERAAVVGFNMVFAEADASDTLAVMQSLANGPLRDVPAFQHELQRLAPQLDHDAAFARALAGHRAVLGYYFTGDIGAAPVGRLPAPLFTDARPTGLTRYTGYGANIETLRAAAPRAGHLNALADPDGVIRSLPLLAEWVPPAGPRQAHPAFALSVLRAALGDPQLSPVRAAGRGGQPGPLVAVRLRDGAAAGAGAALAATASGSAPAARAGDGAAPQGEPVAARTPGRDAPAAPGPADVPDAVAQTPQASTADASLHPQLRASLDRMTQLHAARGPGVRAASAPISLDLPLDERGAVRVPVQHAERFARVSAADVLAERLPAHRLAGRIVLVGTTALGLSDLRPTPVDPATPGIVLHASLLAGLLDGHLPTRPDWARGFELASLVIGCVMLALLVPRVPVLAGVVVTGATLLLWTALNAWLYRSQDWVLPLALPLLAAGATALLAMADTYLAEGRSRRALAQLFGAYVPPELVASMAHDPERYTRAGLSAENRELTILFCDLHDFTRTAEHLAPEQLREVVNLFFSRMSAIIAQHGGTLDKFIGDAVMAFWGAPVETDDHAARAVRAALDMRRSLASLNAELRQRGLPQVHCGIGLNTGLVCVGELGSDARRSYSVIGDPVNLASRIEDLTRTLAVDVLVGEGTWRAASAATADLPWRMVGLLPVKGRSQPIPVYTPLHAPAPAWITGPATSRPAAGGSAG
ncbi:MAG: CHASE2 domain-containing protein [Burkholderiales bacterium]|nr:CHASE2 domain-containing protein [Burkholderiales bacterium]